MAERENKQERKTKGVVIDYDLLYRMGQIIDQVGFDMEMSNESADTECFCAKHAHMDAAIDGMNKTLKAHIDEYYPEGTVLGDLLSDELYAECDRIEQKQVDRVEGMFKALSESILTAALAGNLEEDSVN